LQDADLFATVLTDANLTGANLRGAGLKLTDFDRADLNGADLTGAHLGRFLSREEIEDVILHNALLSNTIWFDGRVCAAGSIHVCN
jgi:uncharacterized protein YjbI with pentapeptide repeats